MFNTASSRTSSTSSAAHSFEAGGSMASSNGSGAYSPTSILHHHSLPPFPTSITRTWGGVGGFTTPLQPAPPLCAPPLTVASSLGNPQMPSSSMYNSSSPMGYHFRVSSTNMIPACKRKPDDDLDDKCPSAKQHITEEKVSAGLKSLHLSPHFTSHTLGNSKNTDGSVLVKDCTEDTDSNSSSGTTSDASPRLYFNTDINKVSIENRSSLPERLLKNLNRDGPCLEVVLWQPRSQVLSSGVSFEGGRRCQQPADDDLICEPGSARMTTSTSSSTATLSTTSVANGFASFYNSASAGGSAISSPDSGVSISPPSDSTASFETTCEMDEDAFSSASAGLAKVSSGSGGLTSSMAGFSSNPFSLFYPSPSAASSSPAGAGRSGPAASSTLSASVGVPPASSDLADLLLQNNNNNNNGSAASAYTRSWVEENNNTGLRDLNSRPTDTSPLRVDLLPPLPDDDDMDL